MAAPRIPNDIEYWKKKGKSGKNVCLIIHDDMDGIVSGILMKEYLENHGFTIVNYAIINYQESWDALRLDSTLINIALDYAEDASNIDVYMDHHGSFEEELRITQKRPAIKTHTGSAAEGVALQLGVPFAKEVKDWIDMIDSAKYYEYNINISDILNFDLKAISKDPNSKLRFASAFNQLLKRSDYKTFIEVVNASNGVSIYNIFRLFKIFFPKNNPNWVTGIEPKFVEDGISRIKIMQEKTRGTGEKVRYMSYNDFWKTHSSKISDLGYINDGWKISLNSYQIIGNLMFVPSGTWANALRAKAIFHDDQQAGVLPNDPKLNFSCLQYGNTIQIADLVMKMEKMASENVPILKNGKPIRNLGDYLENLVKNFKTHLGYSNDKTLAGGHFGIGTISNIFGVCTVEPYMGIPFLDLFKNKIINDISGVKWKISMPWNDEIKKYKIPEDQINKRMLNVGEIRTEEDVAIEEKEKKYLCFAYQKDEKVPPNKFKTKSLGKISKFLDTSQNLKLGELTSENISKIQFFNKLRDKGAMEDIPWILIFDHLIKYFPELEEVYDLETGETKKEMKKEIKRLLSQIGMIVRGDYINEDILL